MSTILPNSALATAAHTSVSERYRFVSTAELVRRLTDDHGFSVRSASEARSRRYAGYQKHVVRLVHGTTERVGDTVPELVLVNAHAGTASLQIRLGLYRLVCANGLMAGFDLGGARVRHVGDARQIAAMAAALLVESMPALSAAVARMQQIQVSDALSRAFAAEALALRGAPERDPQELDRLIEAVALTARRDADSSPTLWALFNRVQEHLIRGGFGLRRITSPARDVELNSQLWDLAAGYSARAA